MFRNSVLAGFMVLAFTAMVYVGCSTSSDGGGGGGGDEAKAMSFNGDTSVPATGGAAIALDYGAGFGSVISSMFSALAVDASSESASMSLKLLDDLELGICTNEPADPGTALLNGELVVGETATLTLTNCKGSPLSSAAINGQIVLDITRVGPPVGGTGGTGGTGGSSSPPPLTISATARATLVDFTIGTNTVLGGFAADVNISVSSLVPLVVTAVDLVLGEQGTRGSDSITVNEKEGGELTFACFKVSMSISVEPPSFDSFEPRGVLLLGDRVYTLNNTDPVPNIGFALSDSGPAVPNSGTLRLDSGDPDGCFSRPAVAGDGSGATATFTSGGKVGIVAEGSDGKRFECIEDWDDLLNTLRDLTAFDSCPCVANCGTGGTAGSGGSGAANYCASYVLFSTSCFPQPEFGDSAILDIQGSSISYVMTVGGLPEAGPEYDFSVNATGTLDGTVATGTGDPVTGIPSDTCDAPEARLQFDIEFDQTRANYGGTINFDFTLDANCGSSICSASASVQGRLCP
ncbi:MAG: hypothetical protein WBM96_06045 [Polyangiales bacterium]